MTNQQNSSENSRLTIMAILLLCIFAGSTSCDLKKAETSLVPQTVPVRNKYTVPHIRPTQVSLQKSLARLDSNPNQPEIQLETGILYQMLSPPDRWDYLEKAIELLSQARNQMPKSPELLLYLGLSKAANARNPDVNLLSKLGLARSGFTLMDQAIALDSKNLSLRLLRAKASLVAPAILNREKSLGEDHTWIKSQATKLDEVPLHLLAMSFIFLGDHAHRQEDNPQQAKYFWQQAIKAGLGTDWGIIARNRLEGKPSDF